MGAPSRGRENGGMATDGTLRMAFSLRAISGLVAVSVSRSTDPDAIGYRLLSGGVPLTSPRASRSAGRR
jgi:hypothetical protein